MRVLDLRYPILSMLVTIPCPQAGSSASRCPFFHRSDGRTGFSFCDVFGLHSRPGTHSLSALFACCPDRTMNFHSHTPLYRPKSPPPTMASHSWGFLVFALESLRSFDSPPDVSDQRRCARTVRTMWRMLVMASHSWRSVHRLV